MNRASKFRREFRAKDRNNVNSAVDIARFIGTVREFVELVRQDSFKGREGERLMEDFCDFVNDPNVWTHAEKVVCAFRMTWQENMDEQARHTADYTCLNFVLSRLKRLPRPNDDIMTTEMVMIKQRFKSFAYNLLTGGTRSVEIAQEDVKLVDQVLEVFDRMDLKPVELPASHIIKRSSTRSAQDTQYYHFARPDIFSTFDPSEHLPSPDLRRHLTQQPPDDIDPPPYHGNPTRPSLPRAGQRAPMRQAMLLNPCIKDFRPSSWTPVVSTRILTWQLLESIHFLSPGLFHPSQTTAVVVTRYAGEIFGVASTHSQLLFNHGVGFEQRITDGR
ncbi:MAG: hypothetical protein Q9193_004657 [Seirophora villosa]